MLQRKHHQNYPFSGSAPEGAVRLERDGHYLLRGVLSPGEVAALREEILWVYECFPPDMRSGRASIEDAAMYRYEMFNRSPRTQTVIGHPKILSILEPLLGQDCHVIQNTAWRNPPGNSMAPRGLEWHVDGGPHVPRKRGVAWPRRIPYPVFVIATHIYLADVGMDEGPTAFVPGSHTSGRLPPYERRWAQTLSYRRRRSVPHLAQAGDVSFFVSDVWHRRLAPTASSAGRFFLQTNYGRREIAQRVRPTDVVNHASPEAIRRARTERERQLIGLHEQAFYDG